MEITIRYGSYSPEGDIKIIDAKFSDLNQDGIEELIIIQRSNDKFEC